MRLNELPAEVEKKLEDAKKIAKRRGFQTTFKQLCETHSALTEGLTPYQERRLEGAFELWMTKKRLS